MIDPLAEVVALLQPGAQFSKVVSGAGPWRVRRSEAGQPFYCVILDGSCRLAVDGHAPITLEQGDFVLIPSAYGFAMSSLDPATSKELDTTPVELLHGEFRLGIQDVPHDVLLLLGHCTFGSPDAALLVSLLPQLVHVRGERRLATIVQLVGEEARELRPVHHVVPGGDEPLAPFPNIKRWFQAINARPAAARARAVGKDHAFKTARDEEALRALFPSNYPELAR